MAALRGLQDYPSVDAMARVGDLLIAVVLIILTLPLMVIVALAIKLDSPGPVLSKREEWGPQGHKFQLFGFRTESNALQGANRLPHPPITPIGAFLCWTRMDSLPQLINVLRGDLTIVGTGRRPDFAD
jgi:lipopolysaccharide/colanic/teichoic acid biosynthesis glycosyltransferase